MREQDLSSSFVPNPFYASLTSRHARFCVAHRSALRFEAGTIPFGAVPAPDKGTFTDLSPLLAPGEEIYVTIDSRVDIPAVPHLQVVSILESIQMRFVLTSSFAEEQSSALKLALEDTDAMLNLKARAFPGFFGPRAPELGTFFGIKDTTTQALVAMGGERLATDDDHEISAVCTDPAFVGRGYAAQIMRRLLRHHAEVGVGSILHAAADNVRAISLYEHLGFSVTGTLNFAKLLRV